MSTCVIQKGRTTSRHSGGNDGKATKIEADQEQGLEQHAAIAFFCQFPFP